jgi:hypothetical protein
MCDTLAIDLGRRPASGMLAARRSWILFLLALGLLMSQRAAAALHLTTPADFQVFQRATAERGAVRVAGQIIDAPTGKVSVEVQLTGAAADRAWRWVADLGADGKSFAGEFAAPAGGWYQLNLRVVRDGLPVADTNVAHVGVGEVFVVAGQSNSANHGEEKLSPASDQVVAFSGTAWQPARDPQPGASGGGGSFLPPFGDALAAHFRVPIGLVSVGVGATSVREWLPRGTRFRQPPTLTGNVTQLPSGEWESTGTLFANLTARLRQLGPNGFRAVLWHQGESDANQPDPARTLPGELYRRFLEQLIGESRRAVGWEFPWFVAQVSYHTPDDPGSPDLRAAQAALWRDGIALPGPDTDALTGDLRDGGGKGVHFSGKGQRVHGAKWAEAVTPWLGWQLATAGPASPATRLNLPRTENLKVAGRPAFVFLPPANLRTNPQPWVLYAPTLPPYPDEAERWMHERFLAAGVAVAGVDVGEAYGSPGSHVAFAALYRELAARHGFAAKPCVLARSRGGLMLGSWAAANPDRVAGLAGIYPVFDFRSYPGLDRAAPAYGLTAAELGERAAEFNPVARASLLARAGVPAFLLHGDVDTVVPLPANSGAFAIKYGEASAAAAVKLVVLPGQGHNMFGSFFRSQELVDFVIAKAREGGNR